MTYNISGVLAAMSANKHRNQPSNTTVFLVVMLLVVCVLIGGLFSLFAF